jgi:hypothetical protein
MLNENSLFGEESPEQIAQLIREQDPYVWEIRETALIAVVNEIRKDEEALAEMENNETFSILESLYAYTAGFHHTQKEEYEARNRAYKLFRAKLAREGKLVENLDLVQDMP